MKARQRSASTVAVCAALLVLSGCGSDSTASQGDPSGSTSSGVSPSPSASTSVSPSASPSVVPATGPLLKMDVAEVNAPTGWEHEEQLVPLEDGARLLDQGRMSLFETPWFGNTLEEIAKFKLKGRRDLQRLPDTEIGGLPVIHITDRGPQSDHKYRTEEQFTGVYLDSVISVLFQLDRDVPEAERQRIVQEVLASVRWK